MDDRYVSEVEQKYTGMNIEIKNLCLSYNRFKANFLSLSWRNVKIQYVIILYLYKDSFKDIFEWYTLDSFMIFLEALIRASYMY